MVVGSIDRLRLFIDISRSSLGGVLKLYRVIIRLLSEDTLPEIRDSRRFYPYFKVNIATCVFL